MDKYEAIQLIIFIVLAALSGYAFAVNHYQRVDYQNQMNQMNIEMNERVRMASGINLSQGLMLNGIWFGDGYICEYVRGKYNLSNTVIHEACHELVYQNSTHFCE
jgi:hypothetical protein